MSKWQLPNGLIVDADDEKGTITSIKRPAPTAGASGGRSPGGLTTGPGSVDPDDQLNEGDATPPVVASSPSRASRVSSAVVQPFKDIGNSALRANSAAANAIVHPVDTARAVKANPLPYAREALRGINGNIPGANTAVEAIGGPPASSPEDQAVAPGISDLTGLASAPLVGGVVGDTIGAVARPIGEAAQARIDRRLPTTITGETRTKAAKSVIGSAGNGLDDSGGRLLETLNAHPELKHTLSTEPGAALRADAVSATKSKLNAETLGDFGAVDKHLGGFESDEVIANLKSLAKNSTSPATQDAATNIAADIERRYGPNGKIPALKLRDYRNELGEFAFKTPPASPAALPSREAALRQVHSAINDAIEDTMRGLGEKQPSIGVNDRGYFHSSPQEITGNLREGTAVAHNVPESIQYIANHGPDDGFIHKVSIDRDANVAGIEEAKEAAENLGMRTEDMFDHDFIDNKAIRAQLKSEGWDAIEFTDQGPAHTGNNPHKTTVILNPDIAKIEKTARVKNNSIIARESPVDVEGFKQRNRQVATLIPVETTLREQAAREAGQAPGGLAETVRKLVHPKETAIHAAASIPSRVDAHLARLAGSSGPQGIAALKQVVLSPSRESIQAAVRAGIPPQVALQVARLGTQSVGAQ